MAQTLYGATLFKSPSNDVNFNSSIIGKNSEVITSGDILTIDASDGLKVGGATDTVIGVAVKTTTMTSSNETVAKVTPSHIAIDKDYEFLMGTNADMSALTSVGAYYKLAGTTGAQQVDVNSGAQTTTNRVVMCTKVDPNNLGGTGSGSGLRQGIFKFVKVFNVKSNT
jgi:hypothetical protein